MPLGTRSAGHGRRISIGGFLFNRAAIACPLLGCRPTFRFQNLCNSVILFVQGNSTLVLIYPPRAASLRHCERLRGTRKIGELWRSEDRNVAARAHERDAVCARLGVGRDAPLERPRPRFLDHIDSSFLDVEPGLPVAVRRHRHAATRADLAGIGAPLDHEERPLALDVVVGVGTCEGARATEAEHERLSPTVRRGWTGGGGLRGGYVSESRTRCHGQREQVRDSYLYKKQHASC